MLIPLPPQLLHLRLWVVSPDLNPIEMIFSNVKQLLRSLACRTRDQVWSSMQSVLDRETGSDARNCFEHCGCTLQGRVEMPTNQLVHPFHQSLLLIIRTAVFVSPRQTRLIHRPAHTTL